MLRSVAVFCIAAAVWAAQADGIERGRCQVDGFVTDQSGHPLSGVRIRLQRQGADDFLELRTNASGQWAARNIAGGDWDVTFALPGYLPQNLMRTIYPRSRQNRTQVAMTRTPFTPGLAEASFEAIVEPDATPTPLPEEPFDIPEGEPLDVARALAAEGHYKAAVVRFEALLAAAPDHNYLHQEIGDCYLHLADYDHALEEYTAFYESDPESTAALSDLAEVHLKRREVDKALIYLHKLIERDPTHPTANYDLAEILLGADEPEEAIPHYEAAIAGRPDWPQAYLKLGYAELSVGRAGKALEAFQKYLLLDPDGSEAPFVRDTIQILK